MSFGLAAADNVSAEGSEIELFDFVTVPIWASSDKPPFGQTPSAVVATSRRLAGDNRMLKNHRGHSGARRRREPGIHWCVCARHGFRAPAFGRPRN